MWIKFAFFEGLAKTSSSILQKFIGKGNNYVFAFFGTLVIGFMQMLGGFLGAKIKKEKIIMPFSKIYGSIIFGTSASVMTILGIYTFTLEGADIGIATFIISLAIIPGIFIDRIFFKEKITLRKIIGIIIFIITAFIFILDMKKSGFVFNFQKWMIFPCVTSLLLAFNEGITKKIRNKIEPFANNFWIGLTTIIISCFGLAILKKLADFKNMPGDFWVFSLAIGMIVLIMISCKLLSYKLGGNIAVKQFIMQGTYLITSNIFGFIIFSESWTIGKTIGIPMFFIAFLITRKEAAKSL